MVKYLPIAYQRHEVCAAQSYHAAAYLLPQGLFQTPDVDAHQQGGAQSVDTHQWVAHNSCDYDKDQSQTVALGQCVEGPQQCRYRDGAQSTYEDVSWQFQEIYPVAHVDDGEQQQSHRHQCQRHPLVLQSEGFLYEPHHQ